MTTRDANKEEVGSSLPPARRSGGMERLRSRYGPWAVVTGASSGIGRGMALQLADAGLSVVLVARSQDALDKLAADLCSRPGVEARTVAVDLALEAGTVEVEEDHRHLDNGLVNAPAGVGTSGPFLESSLEEELE